MLMGFVSKKNKKILEANENLRTLKRESNALKKELGSLKEVIENLTDGVIIVNKALEVIFINKASRSIFEVTSKNQNLTALVNNSSISDLAKLALLGKTKGQKVEISYPCSKSLEIKTKPIKDSAGGINAAVLIITDTTAIEALAGIKKDFIANVSHELRTPISTISALMQALMSGAKDEKKDREKFLADISNEIERLSLLSRDILDLNKIESDKVQDKEAVDLSRLLKSTVKDHDLQAKNKAIDITLKIKSKDPTIMADFQQLSIAFSNLIDNSIKYTKENGQVTVELTDNNSSINIKISDNGIGIPSKDIPRIFERFYRVGKDRAKKSGGTGLGLSITKHAIENHKGKIEVKSSLGKGSEFIVTLPRS
ncbi:MAG: hypothetical protein C4562_02160 [Actinobacteria bacterium]|nr:MAG: hypothetical protein C4562_02160 [Actinomycetota bacterium]